METRRIDQAAPHSKPPDRRAPKQSRQPLASDWMKTVHATPTETAGPHQSATQSGSSAESSGLGWLEHLFSYVGCAVPRTKLLYGEVLAPGNDLLACTLCARSEALEGWWAPAATKEVVLTKAQAMEEWWSQAMKERAADTAEDIDDDITQAEAMENWWSPATKIAADIDGDPAASPYRTNVLALYRRTMLPTSPGHKPTVEAAEWPHSTASAVRQLAWDPPSPATPLAAATEEAATPVTDGSATPLAAAIEEAATPVPERSATPLAAALEEVATPVTERSATPPAAAFKESTPPVTEPSGGDFVTRESLHGEPVRLEPAPRMLGSYPCRGSGCSYCTGDSEVELVDEDLVSSTYSSPQHAESNSFGTQHAWIRAQNRAQLLEADGNEDSNAQLLAADSNEDSKAQLLAAESNTPPAASPSRLQRRPTWRRLRSEVRKGSRATALSVSSDDDCETPPPKPSRLMRVRSAAKMTFRKAWRLHLSRSRGAAHEVSFAGVPL